MSESNSNNSATADSTISDSDTINYDVLAHLHLSDADREFLKYMMQERMEYLWVNRATLEKRQAENAQKAEANRPYFELLDTLPDEQLEIINKHSDRVSGEHSEECDFYYFHGFLDGFKAAGAIRNAR